MSPSVKSPRINVQDCLWLSLFNSFSNCTDDTTHWVIDIIISKKLVKEVKCDLFKEKNQYQYEMILS